MIIPKDYQLEITGTYYKIGVHGFVFIWDGVEWIRSSKSSDSIRRLIKHCNKYTHDC